jgi:hypothetical protein
MNPRLERTLVLGLGLLLLGGLLLSGGIHAAVHADDATPCDVCALASDAPGEPIFGLDPIAFVRFVGDAPDTPLLDRSRREGPSPRGPPLEI